jgi:hypothetical protein
LAFDADEFYTNDYVKYLNELMAEGKADIIRICGSNFAFSFKWRFVVRGTEVSCTRTIYKKTPSLFFVPTSQPRNAGNVIVEDRNKLGRFHYNWVKPRERLLIRHRTSGFKPGMLKWFNKNWDTIELKDGRKYEFYNGNFVLKRYDGKHPEILADHPWKDVEDVRKI